MNNELYHYNHNHDPKTGKFTFSRGGIGGSRGSGLFRKKKPPQSEKTEPAERKVMTAEEQKADFERRVSEAKKRAIESGSATEVAKYQKYFTDQELSNARNRLSALNDIKRMAQSEKKPTRTQQALSLTRQLTEYVNAGANAYKAINSLTEAIDSAKEKKKISKSRKMAKDALDKLDKIELTKENMESVKKDLENTKSLAEVTKQLEDMASGKSKKKK